MSDETTPELKGATMQDLPRPIGGGATNMMLEGVGDWEDVRVRIGIRTGGLTYSYLRAIHGTVDAGYRRMIVERAQNQCARLFALSVRDPGLMDNFLWSHLLFDLKGQSHEYADKAGEVRALLNELKALRADDPAVPDDSLSTAPGAGGDDAGQPAVANPDVSGEALP